MRIKVIKFIVASITLMILVCSILYLLSINAHTQSPLARMKSAQEIAKMSGQYQFHTDVEQISNYAPSITNYGRESRRDQLSVDGAINESTQTSNITITNARGVLLEVRRERGITYSRQPGTGWQRVTSNMNAQINTLNYLAGMTHAQVAGKDINSFDFGFDGKAFAEHFARLLNADTAHGIKYNDEWHAIAQSSQFKQTTGNGNLTIDNDGLPKNMLLNLTMPGNNSNGTVQTTIKTSFFGYARTGLALQKILHNPFTVLGNMLGSDTKTIQFVLFSLLTIFALIIFGLLAHLFRARLYLPITMLALGMLVFQPFSTIPRTQAAASQGSSPTPGPDTTTTTQPAPQFNPFVAPLQQAGGIVLPSAKTSTAQHMVVVPRTQNRTTLASSTELASALDTDKDGLNDTEEIVFGSNPTKADTDGDGLNDFDEYKLGTLATKSDTDDDALNDFVEIQLGTNPSNGDTDDDGLSDYLEVVKFSQYTNVGNKFYTNPLESDTNQDGTTDGQECSEKLFDQNANCSDTNNDAIPDFVTHDNDGDQIPDGIDLSPELSSNVIYTSTNPYLLELNNTTTAIKPLSVDIQVRPVNSALRYANNAIYNWPTGDTEGQVQRGIDSTFASSSLFLATDTNAANGDIKVTTMMEFRIPITSNYYGNLPVTACSTITDKTPIQLNSADNASCVDTKKTSPYGMSIGWGYDKQGNTKTNEIMVSVPLIPDYDNSGTIVAYTLHMYYETSAQLWSSAHQIRMQWLIHSIQDSCPETTSECTPDERVEFSALLQSYYSDWYITGIKATENHGTKASVITEDSTKEDVTNPSKRRLAITQLANLLKNGFVDYPYFQIDGSDKEKSIPVLFDNTKNSAAAVATTSYGINKNATRISSFTYPTMLNSYQITSSEMPKILNDALCRSKNKSTNCTSNDQKSFRAECENNPAINCQPATIIATETNERSALVTSLTTLDFQNQDFVRTRTVNGMFFKVENDRWVPFDDAQTDITLELALVQQQMQFPPTPTDLSDEDWQGFTNSFVYSNLMTFTQVSAKGLLINDAYNTQVSALNKASFADLYTNQWNDLIMNVYTPNSVAIQDLIAQIKQTTDPTTQSKIEQNVNTYSLGLSKSIVSTVIGFKDAYKAITPGSNASYLDIVVATLSLLNTLYSAYGAFGDPTQKDISEFSVGGTTFKIPTITPRTMNIISTSIALALALKQLNDITGVLSAVITFVKVTIKVGVTAGLVAANAKVLSSMATSAAKATSYTTFFSRLGQALVVLAVVVTWVVGIMTAISAEYGFQKANAIGNMVGTTIAILFVFAISLIPGIGQALAAIIGVLDAIAALVCATISDKQKRSTAGQWLCGGITGIISNLFNPYAANLVVNPDDPYSHNIQVVGITPKINTSTEGFRVGNTIKNGLTVTDYIERMPFPSTWMAIPWFWQWLNQDTRDASFTYALGPQQDVSYAISRKGQYHIWQANNWCDTAVPGCTYYAEGDKTYTYKKSMLVNYDSTFTTAGINTVMPDLYLSTASKVPQQTCINLWILLFFPVPICWIETHTGNPKYININEGNQAKYDIFPATIDEFVSMSGTKETGYTFAWASNTVLPTFPVFADADNDGLTNAQERTRGTSDNNVDSDNDGISDTSEITLGTNPINVDSDQDGLTDAQELQFGTDPLKADSDGDGLLDAEEVVHINNRTGLLTGGWEITYAIVNGVPQTTWTSSDPLSADGDNDGIIDLRERVLGWSPYAKNSGDIVAVSGSVREALMPLLQVNFEGQATTGFTSSGTSITKITCVGPCPTVSTTERPPNASVTFNGTQSLNAGNGAQSTFDSQFTFATWLKPNSTALQTIFNQVGLVGVFRTASGNIRIRVSTIFGIFDYVSTAIVPINTWSHIAVTFTNEVLVVYINGVEQSRSNVPGRVVDLDRIDNNLTVAAPVVITQPRNYCYWRGECLPSGGETASAYTGGMDDITIYQIGLRAIEIQQLKNDTLQNGNDLIVRPGDQIVTTVAAKNKLLARSLQGSTTVTVQSPANGFEASQTVATSLAAATDTTFDGTFTVPGSFNNSTNPSTYTNSCVYAGNELCVKFDEISNPPTFTDLSPNGSTLTCNSTLTCPIFTSSDQSWRFNNDTDIRTNPSVGNAISYHNFTISAWIRPEGQATVLRTIVSSTKTVNNTQLIQIALNAERPQFGITGATALLAPSAVPINTWSHVTFTLTNQKRQIYVNGVLVANDTSPIAYPASFGVLQIGKDNGLNSLNGSLRDLQIYSTALTQRQITALTNTCEDNQLIACIPLNGSTSDMSVYGSNQGVTLTNGTINGVLTSSATLPTGYAKLLSEHDFSIITKVKLGSTTTNQPIFKTNTALGNGNQLTLATNGSSVATLTIGANTVTAGITLLSDVSYVIAARYTAGKLSLSVQRASGSTLQTSSNTVNSSALFQAQEPVTIGANGMTINNIRIYRTAVSDATVAAVARNSLFGTISVALNQPPISDNLQINVDARNNVINPNETTILQTANNCDATTVVVCLPLNTSTASYYTSPLSNAIASQSSTVTPFSPQLTIDNNRSTFAHTQYEAQPWFEIDLKSSITISNVLVTNRLDCCGTRISGAIVFLSTQSLGTSKDIAANKRNSVAWKNLGCNDQAATCTTLNPDMLVTFANNTNARYIRIQLVGTEHLHMAEVDVNVGTAKSCQIGNRCPTTSSSGALFTAGKQIAISPAISKATFEGPNVNFTVMTWVRFNDVNGAHMIFMDRNDNSTTNNRLFFQLTGGKLHFGYYGNDLLSKTILAPNIWYHVGFSKNGARRTIFLNGVEDASDLPTGANASVASAREMFIGEYNEGGASVNGYLRDFQIHNQALTSAQITAIASTRFAFNEPPATTTFSDATGSGITLGCSDDNCPLSGQPGRNNQAIHFDGNQSLIINATNRDALDYLNDVATPRYTLSMWIRPNQYNSWIIGNDVVNQKMRIGITKEGFISYEQGRAFSTTINQINRTVQWPVTPLLSTQKIPLNMWSHVTVSTLPGAEYMYVNGQVTSRSQPAMKAPITVVAGNNVFSTSGLTTKFVNSNNSSNIYYPSVASDALRTYYNFDNTTMAVSMNQTHPLHGATSATIGMWVYPESLSTKGNSYILASQSDYQFLIGHDGLLWFALNTSTNTPAWQWNNTGLYFQSDKWQYFSMVLNANEPDATKKLAIRINRADNSNPQIKYYAASGFIKDDDSWDLLIGANSYDWSRQPFTGKIGNIFITPRAVTDSELAQLQTEPLTISNARKYGNVDSPAALTIGQNYTGDLDELRMSMVNTGSFEVAAEMAQSPNWNLTFEDTLNNERTLTSDGVTKTVQIDAVSFPDDVPARNGMQRVNFAASCDIAEISLAECPVGNTIGLMGIADIFNGQTTMLQVGNGTTIIDEIKTGGTLQLTLKPDKITGTQTIMHYGNSSGANSVQLQLVDGKVKLTLGTRTFMASNALPKAWNQITFVFGATGIKYFQNGVQDTGVDSASGAITTLTTNSAYKLRIGGKLSGSAFIEMYQGGIDDITITPSLLSNNKVVQTAQSQMAQAVTRANIANLTIDADTPIVNIVNMPYTARLPRQFIINTSDASSFVNDISVAITSTRATNGSIITTPRTITLEAPACSDAVAGSAYCPTFSVPPTTTVAVEGTYGITAEASDAVGNIGVHQSLIFVDTTPPTATLIRPTGTYTSTWANNQNMPEITLQLSASDPVLSNSRSTPGSGVAHMEINLKDASGRIINQTAPIPAVFNSGVWSATIKLPFGNPSGFYQVGAILTDNVGNQSNEIMVADANTLIEVDGSAPHDTINFPSPDNKADYFISNQAITGRISDISDGRSPLHQNLRVRLDFEAPDGAKVFDNRADSRYNTSCSTCPIIAIDSTDTSKRVARFNIDAPQQSLTIANVATVLTGTFSIAFMAKISDAGTIISTGIASNPRLRIKAIKSGTTFKVTAQKGSSTISTPATLTTNTWYYFIYSEFRDGSSAKMNLAYGNNLTTMVNTPASTITTIIPNANNPIEQNDIVIGAMQSGVITTNKEDYFRGAIDDVLISGFALTATDLIGKSISLGSGVNTHQTRLAINDDGFTVNDGLAQITDFYLPINQPQLPVVDALNGVKSDFCRADITDSPSTCPSITDGFSSNAVQFNRISDGLNTNYPLQTNTSSTKSIALRFKLLENAQSGVIAWLQSPTTTNSLALQFVYQQNAQRVVVTINDKNATLLADSEAFALISDTNWHTVVVTSTGNGSNEQIAVYIDDTQIASKTVAGHWVDASLGIGALTGVTAYANRGTITTAAIDTVVDDIAVFNRALTTTNIIDYSFGYSTVYHETFDIANVGQGAITVDSSPYHQQSILASGNTNIQSTQGIIGTAALVFDGDNEVIHRDTAQVTFAPYNQPWSMSTWLTPKNSASTATIVKGTLNSYTYELSLNAGKPRFSMAGMTIESSSQIPTTNASHIVITSDGTTLTMYVNGQSVASTATSAGSTSFNRALTLIPFSNISQSSTDSTNSATNGYDGNLSTIAVTDNETNPYWGVNNPSNTAMDSVTIYSKDPSKPLYNFTVFVSDVAPVFSNDPTERMLQIATVSKWSYSVNTAVSDYITIPFPNGMTGKFFYIVADGNNRSLALNDVQINRIPIIKIGTGFNGIIDDVRIYRRALNTNDITRLAAMAWQSSSIDTSSGYPVWQRTAVTGIEANTSIQSMAVDNNNNSQVSTGETSLWSGSIDTLAPRINVTNSSGNYSVTISDRNLDPTKIATPCGNKLALQNQLPDSLWFLQRMSVLDGTYKSVTGLQGSCTLSNYPELIQTNIETISATTTLVYGSRFAYMGGTNQIATLTVQSGTSMIQRVTPIIGTVTQLAVNRTKTKLYVISKSTTVTTLTILDIARDPSNPIQLDTFPIQLASGIAIASMGVANDDDSDTFVMLADTSSPQNLISIDVSNPNNPQSGEITTLSGTVTYGMAVQADLLVLALGSSGITIYRINANGRSDAIAQYNTPGYAQKVFFNGNDLQIIDDDEPSDDNTALTTPNTLLTVNLVNSVMNNQAVLNNPIAERNIYQHTTPFEEDNVVGYRIHDVVPYRTNEALILSTAVDYPNNQRISIVNTAGNSALLLSDTRVNTSVPIKIATNGQLAVAMTRQIAATYLTGYQISDARLDTYACDQLNNCTTVQSTTNTTINLGQTPPAQSSIRIIDSTNSYTSDTQTFHVNAESTTDITQISIVVNGSIVETHSIDGTRKQVEAEFNLNLPSGSYIISAQFQNSQSVIVTSNPLNLSVDYKAPTINIIDKVIGASQTINGLYIIRMEISDDVGLNNLQITNKLTNDLIPFTLKKQGNIATVSAIYNRTSSDNQGFPLRITVSDSARRSTTLDQLIRIDTTPPATAATINATINGKLTPLLENQVVSQTTSINVAWTKISDLSPITLNQLEYTVSTVNGSTPYTATTTVPSNSLSIPAGSYTTLTTAEASRIDTNVRLGDVLGNEGLTPLPRVYVDAPSTPDYTVMYSDEPIYREFVNNGCAVLGEDSRSTSLGMQRFAFTWDNQAIRMNWQGADWDYEGELFIYLDTITGGTVQTYQPKNYTQTITDSIAFGDSFITLPTNMAARTISASNSISDYVNTFQTALTQSQKGIRNSTIHGADYVIHIKDQTHSSILRWNGQNWIDEGVMPTYQYTDEKGIKQTDIRALFTQIGYTIGQPFGLLAFATAQYKFLPWATFPTSNPIRTEQGSTPFAITPMLNSYGWANLTDGICPNTAALNPDTTRVVASLTSMPNGVFTRAIADNFANTDPDAISEIISETAPMCAILTTNNWCTTVAQYNTTNNTGSALLDTLSTDLANEQAPVVGNNSIATYTLDIMNPTDEPTRTMYAIVQTYGGIWLTDNNRIWSNNGNLNAPIAAIIGGGIYTYHTVTISGIRDYHLIKIYSIPAKSSRSITFSAKIDPTKAQSSVSNQLNSTNIAKIEVRLTDDGTTTNINAARTVEWLNAAIAIDTSPPSQVLPDNQMIVNRGLFTITGSVSDQSHVSNVYLEYYTDSNSTTQTQVNCGTATADRWACPVTIPTQATWVKYRVRASDIYAQQNAWSGWYKSIVDITPPTFNFNPLTVSAIDGAYVGGNDITLNGWITDSNGLANIKICDESQSVCDFGTTIDPTITQTIITGTNNLATIVNAEPCSNTALTDYTSLPIIIDNNSNTQRISLVTVDVKVTSAAANELDLWMRSPSGTLVPLMTSLRSPMINMLAQFTDSATATTTSLNGTANFLVAATQVKPDGTLSLLSGETINGSWQLLACDRNENSTRSTINQWTITFTNNSNQTSINAPWSYTLKNSANQDNIMRTLSVWGIDSSNNTSPGTTISLNVDTVAPRMTIVQLLQSILIGNQATAFQGTLSEGGTLQSFEANIYDDSTFVKSINIAVETNESQELSRWNYLLNRVINSYTWQLPIDTSTLAAGNYTVQFVATDIAGNQQISDGFPLHIPMISAPSLQHIKTPGTFQNTAFGINSQVNTGSGATTIITSVALESNDTTPLTDTTMYMWDSVGALDNTSHAQIPTVVQNTPLTQLEMNDTLAAALDSNGKLTTWALKPTNTITVTTPISNVVQLPNIAQFAMGASSNPHLLTLSTTGVVTDYTPSGATTVTTNGAVAAITAGTSHNLAILKTGKLYAWGNNTNGETTIPPIATMGVTQIAAGNGFSLALKTDGRLIAWGKNNDGQTTIPLSATINITQIATGDNHALALRADGSVVAWGKNDLGQTTVPILATDIISIVANANSSAAISSDGSVYVWGATQSISTCCAATSSIALNGTQILTNQINTTQSQTQVVSANLDPVSVSTLFTNLLVNSRYKYQITVSNDAGSSVYSGVFTTDMNYHNLYVPFLSNASGVMTPVNTNSGK